MLITYTHSTYVILIKYRILLERLFPRRPYTSFNYYYNLHQTRDMHAWKRFVCRITAAVGDIATLYCNIRNGHLIINHSGGIQRWWRRIYDLSEGGERGGVTMNKKENHPLDFTLRAVPTFYYTARFNLIAAIRLTNEIVKHIGFYSLHILNKF